MYFTIFLNKYTYASSLTYQINMKDRYTVTASIMKNIDKNPNIPSGDLQIFYSILNELESNGNNFTTDNLKSLFTLKNLSFTNSSSYTNEQYKSESYYKYEYYYLSYDENNQPFNMVEKKQLVIYGKKVNYTFIPDGTIQSFVGSTCPTGWQVYRSDGGGTESISQGLFMPSVVRVNCIKVGTEYSYSETTTTKISSSNFFTNITNRFNYFDYGFTMELIDTNPRVMILLVDDDKLLIWQKDVIFGYDITKAPTYKITKYDHYYLRTQKNIIFPVNKSDSFLDDHSCTSISSTGTYFHKLARYNGDSLYAGNQKYTCTDNLQGSYEVIYNINNVRVDDPLVYGTYNFYDADFFAFTMCMHFIADVYPYLYWGNNKMDNSDNYERFIWNRDSYDILDGNILYKYRNPYLTEIGGSKISNIKSNIDLIYSQLSI